MKERGAVKRHRASRAQQGRGCVYDLNMSTVREEEIVIRPDADHRSSALTTSAAELKLPRRRSDKRRFGFIESCYPSRDG
jgi:hypothetical protein